MKPSTAKIVFDTDVVLDLLLDRSPFVSAAVRLFGYVERGRLSAAVCATTVTTVFYLAAKGLGAKRARGLVGRLLGILDVAPVNRLVLEAALASDFGDFEDAVIHEAAFHYGAEALVTRNLRDFRKAKLRVYAPDELAQALADADPDQP